MACIGLKIHFSLVKARDWLKIMGERSNKGPWISEADCLKGDHGQVLSGYKGRNIVRRH